MPEPDRQDLVLGDSIPPPIDSLVLGGIAGLKQQFATATTSDGKIQLLLQAINHDRAGIDLLIEALHDLELIVRAAAYELLSQVDTDAAKEAITQGIPLNPGDRIYRVYESITTYNDNWLYLLSSLDELCYWDELPQSIGSYLFKENAESIAWKHHKQRAFKLDISDIGRDNYYRSEDFDIERWSIHSFLLYRQPDEAISDFAERLRKMFAAIGNTNLADRLWHDFQNENFNLDCWIEIHLGTERDISSYIQEMQILEIHNIISELSDDPWCYLDNENYSDRERRVIRALESLGCDELIGQLWLEVAGKLAFVEEEIVTEPGYFNPAENPQC